LDLHQLAAEVLRKDFLRPPPCPHGFGSHQPKTLVECGQGVVLQ
jgi:hypothetical protein